MEISNSPIVRIESCKFENNTSLGIGTRPFSGNGGGLSIGYDLTPRLDSLRNVFPNISIVSSEFIGNNANAVEGYQYPLLDVLRTGVYNQRGGGIAFFSGTANYSADITIYNCLIQDNSARSNGGGAYIFLGGTHNSHKITVQKTHFLNNRATYVGGLLFSLNTDDSVDNPNQIYISDCVIQGNNARVINGGLTVYQSNEKGNLNNVTITNTSFVNNTAEIGGAVYLQTVFTTRNVPRRNRILLENWYVYKHYRI